VSDSQRIEQTWETPGTDEILALARRHVASMETSDADSVWRPSGMEHVLIRMVGRRSGTERKVALPIWRDSSGAAIVVASFAGAAQHPDWFLNLRDTVANPRVHCTWQHSSFWSVPEILSEDEHAKQWRLLVADRSWYQDYQDQTERVIPLVRLRETGQAPSL
jgi:deazaflavin-dependent oxidoreductase (nitroreductase family)